MSALDRRAVVARLLRDRGETLVVSGLGNPTWDVAALGDDDRNVYLWGAMGGAVSIGLGLALAQPKTPVLVITGDGEMMMGVGSLAVVAQSSPSNLAVAVLDNGEYGETGEQVAHTASGTDLAGMARAAGIADSARVDDEAGLERFADSLTGAAGPRFACIRVARGSPSKTVALANVLRDAGHGRARTRLALGLEAE